MATAIKNASAPLTIPEIKSPAIVSRKALTIPIPGTNIITEPIIILSTFKFDTIKVLKTAKKDTVKPPTKLVKNTLTFK